MTDPGRPLSAAELDNLRRNDAATRSRGDGAPPAPPATPVAAAFGIATLDAERAARPPDAGLLEALGVWVHAALATPAPAPAIHEHRPEYPSSCTGCEHLAADLAARLPVGLLPAPAPDDLDVAKLRHAVRNVERRNDRAFSFDRDIDTVAREYRALQAAPEPATEAGLS